MAWHFLFQEPANHHHLAQAQQEQGGPNQCFKRGSIGLAKRREPKSKLGRAQSHQITVFQSNCSALRDAVDAHQRIGARGGCNSLLTLVLQNQMFVPNTLGHDPEIGTFRLAKRKRKTTGLDWVARRGVVNSLKSNLQKSFRPTTILSPGYTGRSLVGSSKAALQSMISTLPLALMTRTSR